jgi:hypothetical protein
MRPTTPRPRRRAGPALRPPPRPRHTGATYWNLSSVLRRLISMDKKPPRQEPPPPPGPSCRTAVAKNNNSGKLPELSLKLFQGRSRTAAFGMRYPLLPTRSRASCRSLPRHVSCHVESRWQSSKWLHGDEPPEHNF